LRLHRARRCSLAAAKARSHSDSTVEQTGHATSPRDNCDSNSSVEANQPSKRCSCEHFKSRTFMLIGSFAGVYRKNALCERSFVKRESGTPPVINRQGEGMILALRPFPCRRAT
jgi:hypothetical protein